MKKLIVSLCLSLALPFAMAKEPAQETPSLLTLQASTLANDLAQNLLLARLRHQGLGNAMTSGVSLFYALSVLAEGAEGHSNELLQQLLLAEKNHDLSVSAPALAKQLSTSVPEGSPQGVFSQSNSLWSNSNTEYGPAFIFRESFLEASAEHYGATHEALDFLSSDAPRVVNAWAEEKTRGLIPTIVDSNTLKTLDWAVLNAAVFEGAWATQLRRVPADGTYRFASLDGRAQASDTVRTIDYLASVADFDDGSLAFQLPFSGGKYALVVHAPSTEQGQIGEWLINDSIPRTQDVIDVVFDTPRPLKQLTVQMPVFSFRNSLEMRKGSPIAEDLKLSSLFERDADFSGLSAVPSYVSIIKQDTRFELDENGVRAAAVTMIGGVRATSVRPRYPKREIVIDRPFSFAIVERSTRTILFNGVMTSVEVTD